MPGVTLHSQALPPPSIRRTQSITTLVCLLNPEEGSAIKPGIF
jgi:hypothetical protein